MISVSVLKTDCFNNKNLFEQKYKQMSQYRQNRIDRYQLSKDKKLSLAAGVLIDEELKKYKLCEKYAQLCFKENSKPYFSEHPELFFNVSHSKDCAVCVFCDNEVGIDVEHIDDVNLSIAKRFFHNCEYEYINTRQDEKQKQDAFFRLWVLKESYMKATGKGMALPLAKFQINLEDKITVTENHKPMPYSFFEFSIFEDYKTAVAIKCEKLNEQATISIKTAEDILWKN